MDSFRFMGMNEERYGRCVICGESAHASRENLLVCAQHADAIDDGWTIEFVAGKYILVDLEDIDYPPSEISSESYVLPIAADDDSGYSEPLDELHGRIVKLERELAAERAKTAALEAELVLKQGTIDNVQGHLNAIQDYVFAPDALGAENMTADEKAHGMVSQALAALDVIDAAQGATPTATKFAIDQEVILLDGTSLVGKVIARSQTADAYKVALQGDTTGEWYGADDLAAK